MLNTGSYLSLLYINTWNQGITIAHLIYEIDEQQQLFCILRLNCFSKHQKQKYKQTTMHQLQNNLLTCKSLCSITASLFHSCVLYRAHIYVPRERAAHIYVPRERAGK